MLFDKSAWRYEFKMSCDAHRLAQARSWLRLHPAGFQVAFPPRQVNNLYLDTAHLNSFHANLAGYSTRQKLRLRWYGEDANIINRPVLELKLKSDLLGDKRRQELDCELDLTRPYPHLLQAIYAGAGSAWHPWLTAVTQPTLINQYRREYYVTPDGTVRATLDYGQVAYNQRLALRPNRRRRARIPSQVVIEVKASLAHSEAMMAVMQHFPVQRTRHSKYINGVMAG